MLGAQISKQVFNLRSFRPNIRVLFKAQIHHSLELKIKGEEWKKDEKSLVILCSLIVSRIPGGLIIISCPVFSRSPIAILFLISLLKARSHKSKSIPLQILQNRGNFSSIQTAHNRTEWCSSLKCPWLCGHFGYIEGNPEKEADLSRNQPELLSLVVPEKFRGY